MGTGNLAVFGANRVVSCGWLNMTVVVPTHHYLLILKISGEVCGL